ncbi:hit locus [Bdellovibrio bacteriovorus]
MKKVLALSISLVLGFSTVSVTAFAQEDDSKRTVNPGVDPNEAKGTRAIEAEVAAPGYCPECIARMKHGRINDDTTYRPAGTSSTPAGGSSSKEGTR